MKLDNIRVGCTVRSTKYWDWVLATCALLCKYGWKIPHFSFILCEFERFLWQLNPSISPSNNVWGLNRFCDILTFTRWQWKDVIVECPVAVITMSYNVIMSENYNMHARLNISIDLRTDFCSTTRKIHRRRIMIKNETEFKI